jgi:hypothetical protein
MRYIASRDGLARPFQRILRKACQKGGRDRVTGSRSPPSRPAADAAVLAKAKDDLADATVGARAAGTATQLRPRKGGEELPAVLAEVIDNIGAEDYLGAPRLAILKAWSPTAAVPG